LLLSCQMTGPYKRYPGAQITFLVFQAGAGAQ
jgi:hypothetical protein